MLVLLLLGLRAGLAAEVNININGPDVVNPTTTSLFQATIDYTGGFFPTGWTPPSPDNCYWTVQLLNHSGYNATILPSAQVESTVLALNPGDLYPGQTYRITYRYAKFNKSRVVKVQLSDVVANIEGGTCAPFIVDSSDSLVLRSSGSNDPAAAPESHIAFGWSCHRAPRTTSTCNTSCSAFGSNSGRFSEPCPFFTSHNSSVVSVASSNLDINYQYLFQLNFSVSTPGLGLYRSSGDCVVITPQVVHINLTATIKLSPESAYARKVSAGVDLVVAGNARVIPAMPLSYTWKVNNILSWLELSSGRVTYNNRTLFFPKNTIEPGLYVVSFNVQSKYNGYSTKVGLQIQVKASPVITNLTVDRTSGVAYRDDFRMFAVWSGGEFPTLCRFTVNSSSWSDGALRLNSYGHSNSLITRLMPGNWSFSVVIKDALGALVSMTSDETLAVSQEPAVQQRPGFQDDCIQANASIGVIWTLLEGLEEGFNITHGPTNPMMSGICEAVSYALFMEMQRGATSESIRTFLYLLQEVKRIPATQTRVADCQPAVDLSRDGGHTESRCPGLGASATLADVRNAFVNYGIQMTVNLSSETAVYLSSSEQALQALNASTELWDDDVELPVMLSVVDQLVNYLGSTQALSVRAASDALSIYGRSVEVGLERAKIGNSTAACASVDRAVAAHCAVINRVGQAGLLGQPPIEHHVQAANATSRLVLADEPTSASASIRDLASSTGSSAHIPPWSDASLLPQSVVVTTAWLSDLSICRAQPGGGLSLLSPVVSVSLYDLEMDSATTPLIGPNSSSSEKTARYFLGNKRMNLTWDTGTTSAPEQGCSSQTCGYWDEAKGAWNTSSTCQLFVQANGRRICSCRHLTAFALLSQPSQDPSCVSDLDKDLSAGLYYGCAAGFLVLLLPLAVQLYRIRAVRKLSTPVGMSHVLLALVCVSRTAELMILGAVGDDVNPTLSLFMYAVPESAKQLVLTLIVFQWAAVVHNRQMSHNPFQRMFKVFMVTGIAIVLITWCIGAYVVYSPSRPGVRTLIYIPPVAYFLFVIGFVLYSRRIASILTRMQRRASAKVQRNANVLAVCMSIEALTWAMTVFVRRYEELLLLTLVFYVTEMIAVGTLVWLFYDGIWKWEKDREHMLRSSRKRHGGEGTTDGRGSSSDGGLEGTRNGEQDTITSNSTTVKAFRSSIASPTTNRSVASQSVASRSAATRNSTKTALVANKDVDIKVAKGDMEIGDDDYELLGDW